MNFTKFSSIPFFKGCICMLGIGLVSVASCHKETPAELDAAVVASSHLRQCASHEHNAALMSADPQFRANQAEIEAFTQRFVSQEQTSPRAVVTIPVVVHIVYRTAAENISDAQVASQIAILNQDFRKLNSDISLVPSIFSGVAADAEINFQLVQTVRVQTSRLSFSTNNWVKMSNKGGSSPVDPTTKLNIWVCTMGNGILGYAQFPGGSASTDGVVILNKAFGNTGTAAAPFNKGRTATHEIGHWLNLRHIWGDAACGDDFVSDTPAHNAANYGCPATGHLSTCTGKPVEMSMNYMDYTDDTCMYMFSAGQKARMQATVTTGGSRRAYLQ